MGHATARAGMDQPRSASNVPGKNAPWISASDRGVGSSAFESSELSFVLMSASLLSICLLVYGIVALFIVLGA